MKFIIVSVAFDACKTDSVIQYVLNYALAQVICNQTQALSKQTRQFGSYVNYPW